MPDPQSLTAHTPLASRTFVAQAAHMKVVAALMNDPNPIHWDVSAVRAAGMGERVVNQGPITLSFLMNLVMDLKHSDHEISRFDGRFLGNVFDGDEVLCQAWRDTSVDESQGIGLFLLATVEDHPVASAHCRLGTSAAI